MSFASIRRNYSAVSQVDLDEVAGDSGSDSETRERVEFTLDSPLPRESREHPLGLQLEEEKDWTLRFLCWLSAVLNALFILIIIMQVIAPPCWNMGLKHRKINETEYARARGILTQLCENSSSNGAGSCILCLPGWVSYKEKCFYLSVNSIRNWNESREWCTSRHSDLAMLGGPETSEFLKNHEDAYWIGLSRSDDKQWKWINGSNFSSPVHESTEANSDCGVTKNGMLLSSDCNSQQAWICEMESLKY